MKTINTREIYIEQIKKENELLKKKLTIISKLLSVFNFDFNETLELQELGLLEAKEELLDIEINDLGI